MSIVMLIPRQNYIGIYIKWTVFYFLYSPVWVIPKEKGNIYMCKDEGKKGWHAP